MKKNEGIVINGGQFNASQLAVGNAASIINNPIPIATEINKNLDAVIELLVTAKSQPKDIQEFKELADTVKLELSKKSPNKAMVAGVMEKISNGLPMVSSAAKAVKEISQSIEFFIK
jgi:phosphoribosylamine-glycine ligase